MVRALCAVVVAVALLGALGCAGDDDSGGSSELVNLGTAKPVADAFNADRGTPRLVLLLSPT